MEIYLDWESPSGNFNDRAMIEIAGELFAVQRRTHQNDPQFGSNQGEMFEIDEKKVGLHASLVDLTTPNTKFQNSRNNMSNYQKLNTLRRHKEPVS